LYSSYSNNVMMGTENCGTRKYVILHTSTVTLPFIMVITFII